MASQWETTKRIETLVDGIFAIAMTLLVLNLSIPQLTGSVQDANLQVVLMHLTPKLFTYAMSFMLLAIFWRVNHGQFYYIKRINTPLLWITVTWLLFVALVPFSTSLTGEYGHLQSAQIFFDLNLLAIGLLAALIWYYATEKKFTDKKLSLEDIHKIRKINMLLPTASLLAIGLTFISPSWSPLAYASIVITERFFK
ncbi:MAG: DUF1211 domain-containing protein [Methanobacterium sp.]|uniref:TMEM175 family protein n=1 Tax=Methanobacterium sp. TaxID=2164 RepID=UPI003D6498B3|nr:DUF1211 domain-containing protein [Methanobacterium sp.]